MACESTLQTLEQVHQNIVNVLEKIDILVKYWEVMEGILKSIRPPAEDMSDSIKMQALMHACAALHTSHALYSKEVSSNFKDALRRIELFARQVGKWQDMSCA